MRFFIKSQFFFLKIRFHIINYIILDLIIIKILNSISVTIFLIEVNYFYVVFFLRYLEIKKKNCKLFFFENMLIILYKIKWI